MKHTFVCSLVYRGVLGGACYVDEHAVTYRTNKLTVEKKMRHLVLPLRDIENVTWERKVFPIASFHMKTGEKFRLMIFNQSGFMKAYQMYK